MKTEQINIRLEADLVSALERVALEESTDRATALRRLLRASLQQWDIDRVIEAYRRGDVSLGRAAEEAGVTQWELLELLRKARVAYPLDADEVSERLLELGGEETTPESTLADIPPKPGGVLLVGINPAPISVAAGHYYQGPIGRRLWRRLERLGLLRDPVPGHEDEAFARLGHGLTDLVKRPTRSSADLSNVELDAGVEELRRKVREWRPGLILFAFKTPATRFFGSDARPGALDTLEDFPAFLLTGPYAASSEAERIDKELSALLEGTEAEPSVEHEWTQRVTPNDIKRGQIRLTQVARRFFPANREEVQLLLRGERVRAPYDPRRGPDRSRSPVLRIGRERLEAVVYPNEHLRVSRGRSGIVSID
jgi:TDG/mug DNA glycosylase family protein